MVEHLLERNKKFAEGEFLQHNLVQQRKNTLDIQRPHTIVVCCSDSRVCPEFIFNCGIGEIFVVRTAGNIIDSLALESVEFAVSNLPIRQIILMGHTNCGAIRTLYNNNQVKSQFPNISSEIELPIETARGLFGANEESAIMFVTIENLKRQLVKLNKNTTIKHKLQEEQLIVLAGIYNLETGLFEITELT
jgi:carbonic anhydrase